MVKNNIILILLSCSLLFGQYDQDARMLGLSGTYTNIAEGFSCVGVNPANLSYGSNYSINLGSINGPPVLPISLFVPSISLYQGFGFPVLMQGEPLPKL